MDSGAARELIAVAKSLVGLDRAQRDDLSKAVDSLVASLNQKIVAEIEHSGADYLERRMEQGEIQPFSETEAAREYRYLACMRLSEALKRSRL